MTDALPRTADRERADLALLTGPSLEPLLAAVLEAEGVALAGHAVHRVHPRPGVGVTVGCTVAWTAPGATGEEYLLVTTTCVPVTGPGTTTALVDGRAVTVWRHPADPVLPGLAAACDADLVARALGADVAALDLLTYRPLRRAVLRATAADGRTVYLKVVRPRTAADLLRRHDLLRGAGLPVPAATHLRDGVVLLDAAPGTPLTDALAADGARAFAPDAVRDLLDRLPRELADLPRRAPVVENLTGHAAAAAAAVPDRADDVAALAAEIRRLVATTDAGPVVATHGDLHDGNVLLGPHGAVTGLIDVDSAGPGHRVDDLATFLGHLSVLPTLVPGVHAAVPATVARWLPELETDVDPVALRARAAAVALSLVVGTEVDPAGAARRLDVARGWVEAAA